MSTSKNDITGDLIKNRAPSEAYRNNYDAIFRKKDAEQHHEQDHLSDEVQGTLNDSQESR